MSAPDNYPTQDTLDEEVIVIGLENEAAKPKTRKRGRPHRNSPPRSPKVPKRKKRVNIEVKGDEIMFNEKEYLKMPITMSYEMLNSRIPPDSWEHPFWKNLYSLKSGLIDFYVNSKRTMGHPNRDFIFESPESRRHLIDLLKDALDTILWSHSTLILNRTAKENVEYKPGHGLVCKSVVPQETTPLRRELFVVAIQAVITQLECNTYATKRSVYYEHFKSRGIVSQKISDDLLDDIAANLAVPRPLIHILSSPKGLIYGDLEILLYCGHDTLTPQAVLQAQKMEFKGVKNGDFSLLNCNTGGGTCTSIPAKSFRIIDLRSNAKFLLVVEKEATFQDITTSEFCEKYNCIAITSRGYPDMSTRQIVHLVWEFLRIPILALVDGDPHGLDIYCEFKYGSMAQAYDNKNLVTPQMRLIGLRPSDFDRFPFNPNCFSHFEKADVNRLRELYHRPYAQTERELLAELDFFDKYRKKIELQGITSLGQDYLTDHFLPLKIGSGSFLGD